MCSSSTASREINFRLKLDNHPTCQMRRQLEFLNQADYIALQGSERLDLSEYVSTAAIRTIFLGTLGLWILSYYSLTH